MIMYERIIEIIVFVMTELNQNKKITEIDLQTLSDLGYTKEEISTAFSWLADRIELADQLISVFAPSSPKSFRIFNENERDLFTMEAFGEILHLNAIGLLSNQHIEQIIERAVLLGLTKVDSTQLKNFIAVNIFQIQNTQINGSRIMLLGSDTVN